MLIGWLLGCSSTPLQPSAPEAAPAVETATPAAPVDAVPQRAPLTEAERAEVRALLDEAARAIARDHLTYPASGSAMALYDRVRLLDPDNADARAGIDRMVDRYLELALDAAAQGRFAQSGAMLDRARLVEPDHPGIAPVATRIALLGDAERHRFPLDGQGLLDRSTAVIDQLRQAGLASRQRDCRAEIVARNDAEGRWIYQQMNQTHGGERIRAQLIIGAPPRIEVLCFPATDREPVE